MTSLSLSRSRVWNNGLEARFVRDPTFELVQKLTRTGFGASRSYGKYLVSSSDPVTGTTVRMGWYAVNVSANDVATSGIMPNTLSAVTMLPRETSYSLIKNILSEIENAASGLGIKVSDFYSYIAPGLKRPIIVVTAYGSGDDFVTSSNAKVFDSVLMTKTAGIEGTSILSYLSHMKRLSPTVRHHARHLIDKISIIEDARTAFSTHKIHAMHDVTEGGVLGAVYEMSIATDLGFEIYSDSIPIDFSTREVCSTLSIDPLRLIGSGSLLICCAAGASDRVTDALAAKKIECATIGRFLPRWEGRWVRSTNKRTELKGNLIQDEIWRVLRQYRKLP